MYIYHALHKHVSSSSSLLVYKYSSLKAAIVAKNIDDLIIRFSRGRRCWSADVRYGEMEDHCKFDLDVSASIAIYEHGESDNDSGK